MRGESLTFDSESSSHWGFLSFSGSSHTFQYLVLIVTRLLLHSMQTRF
jgi:hypothetical protein